MKDERGVVIAEYNSIMEAEISKSMLESAGIESTIRNEFMSTTIPTGIAPAQLVVREEDEENARKLLNNR